MSRHHHDDHHQHDHHHHDDHRRHRGGPRHERGGGGARGPEGSEFLDLEPTRALLGAASGMAKDVVIDLLRAAVRKRLEERLGAEIERIGFAAADVLADDFEANRRIEAVLEDRKSSRKDLEERLAQSLRGASTTTRGAASPQTSANPAPSKPTAAKPPAGRRTKRER